MPAVWLAHVTDFLHDDPGSGGGGEGPATLVILVGVVLTLATLAALIYLKQRMSAPRDDDPGQSG